MRPGPVKTLPFVFWFLVAGNAVIFALVWLERALAAMDSIPELRSHQVPILGERPSGCVLLGPLDDYDAAEALADRIRGDGGRPIIRERDIFSRPDYVVHVEPSASRDLAMRTLRELKNQAISGHVISDGKLANAVSVGVFGLLAPAEARRRRVANLGYDVNIARFERRRTVYSVYSDERPVQKSNGIGVAPCAER